MGLLVAIITFGCAPVEAAAQGEKLLDLESMDFFGFTPRSTKMEAGPDGKIYFNTNLGLVMRVDLNGIPEVIATIVNNSDPFDPLATFTPGVTFDQNGDMYVCNAQGVYRLTAAELAVDYTSNAPIVLAEPYIPNPGYAFGLGITADNQGHLYMVDVLMGVGSPNTGVAIWKFDIANKTGTPWVSVFDPAYADIAPPGFLVFPYNNLLGSAFGITDIVIDPENDFLYFGTQETTKLMRLAINGDGSAGALETIVDFRAEGMGNYALNGISYSAKENKVVVSAPWNNFENGMLASPQVTVAGGVWTLDVDKYEKGLAQGKSNAGVKALKTIIIDQNVGTAVDAILLGDDDNGDRRIYVSDGGFERPGNWPNAVPPFGAVEEFRLYTPEGAAIRVIEFDD